MINRKNFNNNLELCLKKIISDFILKKNLTTIKSVYLTGSSAGDEAALYLDNDGETKLYNDIDIMIIYEGYIDFNYVNELKIILKNNIGVKWIDISLQKISSVNKLTSSVKLIDLKLNRKLLYGSDFLVTKLINVHSTEIKKWDVFLLFRTRCFCISDSYREVIENKENSDFIYINYQLSKAILSAVDARLISKKKYIPGYKSKILKYIEITNANSLTQQFIFYAYEIKLNPTYNDKSIEFEEFLNFSYKFFWNEFLDSFKILYDIDICCSKAFSNVIKKYELSIFKRIYRFFKHRRDLSLLRYNIQLVQYFLIKDICNNKEVSHCKLSSILNVKSDIDLVSFIRILNEKRMLL